MKSKEIKSAYQVLRTYTCWDGDEIPIDQLMFVTDAENAMHKYHAQFSEGDGWMKVEDRLPDNDTKCSVFVSEGFTRTYYEVWYYPNLKQWWCDGKQVEKVTHWQPLPQPPKQ